MPSSLPAGARCSTRPSTRRSDGWRPKTRGAATARGPQCRAGRQLRLRVPPWSRRVGGAGGRHRDGATATTLAVKHALVAECDECFFDECSRREKWLLHRILRPTSPLAPEYCSNDARRCERPRRRRRRPVDALLQRGSFTNRSKLSVVFHLTCEVSSSDCFSETCYARHRGDSSAGPRRGMGYLVDLCPRLGRRHRGPRRRLNPARRRRKTSSG